MYIFSTQIKDFMGMGVPGHLPPDAVVPSEFMEKVRTGGKGVLKQEGGEGAGEEAGGKAEADAGGKAKGEAGGGRRQRECWGGGWEGRCVEIVSKGRRGGRQCRKGRMGVQGWQREQVRMGCSLAEG